MFASEAKLQQFFQVVQQSLTVVYEVKMDKNAAIQEAHEAGQVDEEDTAAIEVELAKTCGAATYIGEALDVIMSVYKKNVIQLVENNALPYFKQVLATHKEVSAAEQQSALYFFIQFIIECKQAVPIIIDAGTNGVTAIFAVRARRFAKQLQPCRQSVLAGGACSSCRTGGLPST